MLAAESPSAPPGLSVSPAYSSEGYFTLSWRGAPPLLLQQSRHVDFRDAEQRSLPSAEQALTLSGYADGIYHFRAGTAEGRWSAPVSVEVQHPALSRALLFFLLGLSLFAVLVLSILHGHRRDMAGDDDDR